MIWSWPTYGVCIGAPCVVYGLTVVLARRGSRVALARLLRRHGFERAQPPAGWLRGVAAEMTGSGVEAWRSLTSQGGERWLLSGSEPPHSSMVVLLDPESGSEFAHAGPLTPRCLKRLLRAAQRYPKE